MLIGLGLGRAGAYGFATEVTEKMWGTELRRAFAWGGEGRGTLRRRFDDVFWGGVAYRRDMPDVESHQIIGAAIEVHRVLGPGFIESVYEAALCRELRLREIPYEQQRAIDVMYKGVAIHGHRLDLVVFDQIVVEIKSARSLHPNATSQILSYLRATGLQRGLILNFGAPRLIDGIQRISL